MTQIPNKEKRAVIKNIKNGGLLIKCDGSEDASKLKELASLHLADDYEVKEVRKFNPRLKIVGMSECIDKDQLSVILKSQNSVLQNDIKSGKPHTMGEKLILPAGEEVLKTVLHKPASDIIKRIPLSNNTVERRIDEMSSDIESFLCNYLQTTHFSIQLDNWTSQLYLIMQHYYWHMFVLL
ncbi:unnamed protein product [Acanthoscelides obtectus]|uniref:Uncharacterized protein n=1 Tax=Acanthoscelides obtectus TaxID=200917 RepID=A0A9P0Q501_ACAOB|nr:unnamed protein product [Acanthoscelides obtectus]CAK1630800.1 Protein FAM200A [Acanthoscelides obtectus]